MTWIEKAAWLQEDRWGLQIQALDHENDSDGMRWTASLAGDGRWTAETLEGVVELAYDWARNYSGRDKGHCPYCGHKYD